MREFMGSEVNRQSSDRILSASALLISSRLVVQVVSAASTAVVARSISVEDFGNLNAGLAVFYLATALCDWGFGLSLARRLGRSNSRDGSVVRSAVRLQASWSGFVTILVIAYAVVSGLEKPRIYILMLLTPAIVSTGVSVYRQVLIANEETQWIVFPGILINITSAVIAAGLAIWGFGISALAIVVSVASVLNSLVLYFVGRKLISATRGTARLRRSMRREVVLVGLQSFLSSTYFGIDVVILSYLVSSSELGHYTAALKVLTFIILIPGILAQVSVVEFSRIHQDRMSTSDLQTRSWKWLSFGFLPVVALLGLYAPIFVNVYFGAKFDSIIPIVRILMIAGVLAAVSNTIFGAMIASSRQRWLVWQGLFCLIFNVSANLLFVPLFGITASAWLTVITELFVVLGSTIALARIEVFSHYMLRAWKYYVAIPLTSIPPWLLWGSRSLVGLIVSATAIAVGFLVLGLVPQEIVDVLRRRSSRHMTRSK